MSSISSSAQNDGPQFLVVQLKKKSDAMTLVQLMIENGFYSQMLLLDALENHPSFTSKNNEKIEQITLATRSDTITPNEPYHSKYPETAKIEIDDNEYNEEDSKMFEGLMNEALTNASSMDWLEHLSAEAGMAEDDNYKDEEVSSKRKRIEREENVCELCHVKVRAQRGARWNLQMHVLAVHSKTRTMKCAECDYEDYRKTTLRKHCMSVHNQLSDPINIVTNEKRLEWDAKLGQCFPAYATRSGFMESRLV